ncbi:MAG: succinylglutamate desuccinylase/aspartoacylase family protein [Bdellovibrionales bacterium]|nr:succinylglutamate desuccinylase/aspartoacylase family protein [Bdellovibrionales bacterium]
MSADMEPSKIELEIGVQWSWQVVCVTIHYFRVKMSENRGGFVDSALTLLIIKVFENKGILTMTKCAKLLTLIFCFCSFMPINGNCDTEAVPFPGAFGDRAVPYQERIDIMNRLESLYELYGTAQGAVSIHEKSSRIKAEVVGTSDSYPVYKFTFGNPKSQNRVAISSGIHAGTEPLAVVVAMKKLEEVVRRAQTDDDFYMVVYPLLNPWGFLKGTRHNSDGVDYNRVQTPNTVAEYVKSLARSLHGEEFNIALDLHGGIKRKQFFVIRAKDDDGLAARSLSVLPQPLRLESVSGQYPDYAEYKRDPTRYFMSAPGIIQSNTEGTLKAYMLKHAKESYSIEYPGQLERKTVIKKYLELIRSFEKEATVQTCNKRISA